MGAGAGRRKGGVVHVHMIVWVWWSRQRWARAYRGALTNSPGRLIGSGCGWREEEAERGEGWGGGGHPHTHEQRHRRRCGGWRGGRGGVCV